MRRSIIFIVCSLLTVCTTACEGEDISPDSGIISRDDAYDIVLKDLNPSLKDVDIWASKELIGAGTRIELMYSDVKIMSPSTDSWLFFVDEEPAKRWIHNCLYLFVEMDGVISVHKESSPPCNMDSEMEMVNISDVSHYRLDNPMPGPAAAGMATVKIELIGGTVSGHKEDRLCCTVDILDENGAVVMSSEDGGIRLRGNGTRNQEKSPYDLKLDKKASILGMPADKRWVLLANYFDRTSLRNDVGLEIARRADGMPWNPKGEFVNLFFDGEYRGLYFLCEKIKIAKHRVNIDELTEADIKKPEITGGYLLEFDGNDDETIYYTDFFKYPVKIKEPDDVVDAQVDYIMGYLNELESVLSDNVKLQKHLYEDYIDVESFADWWIVGELVMNKDYNAPASCYMYKARNGKLFAGPIWDLDYLTFSSEAHDINSFLLDGSMYYSALLKDQKFRETVKVEWDRLKSKLMDGFSIYDYMEDRSSLIEAAVSEDDNLYPHRTYSWILSGDEYEDFDTAVGMMKSFMAARIASLDRLIGLL